MNIQNSSNDHFMNIFDDL